jgi:Low-density lipoprotein receptor domain class A
MRKLLFVMAVMFGFIACDDDGGGDGVNKACQDTFNKMYSCGLLTEGEYDCSYISTDPQGICEANCFMLASCDDINQTLCTATPVATHIECFHSCEETYGFACDSNNEVIDTFRQCDGFENCTDGSDEDGCPQFICDDNERVLLNYKCDGYQQCSDGSDEDGCPQFICDDNERVPLNFECDGYPHCTDSSDEHEDCQVYAETFCP